MIRSPIITVLGHVDHGKTLLLDKIRGTYVAKKEAGAITQHVGASFIPTNVIKQKCKNLLEKYKFELKIPGLLFIDTPGHEAFTNLRKRGGSTADLAVLVIDITQGIQPQTKEAIEILKANKVPFIVAANKIDLINSWISNNEEMFLETFKKQKEQAKKLLDESIYKLIGQLSEFGFDSDRFDRVKNFTNQILIIPVSAKTGEGIPELLLFLAGLSQKFMKNKLEIDEEKPAKGSVLEVKNVQGLGMTIDAIIYDGCLRKGDEIAIAGKNSIFTTKIRALLLPQPLEEIRDSGKKFKAVEEVHAAAGVKIAAPGLENALAGSPLITVKKNKEEAKREIESELKEIRIEKQEEGVIIKADALGSLEAITMLLKQQGVDVKKADIGAVTKKDVIEAESVRKKNRYLGVIFAFNTNIMEDAKEEALKLGVKIFESKVIYQLEENYKEWKKEEEKKQEEEELQKYTLPAKIKILPGFIFRTSKPAVVGVKILEGTIRSGYALINNKGKIIGKIQNIQEKNKEVEKAVDGMEVAISIQGAVVGRNIKEEDILYSAIPKEQLYEMLSKFKKHITLIREIKNIEEGEG